MADRHSFSNEVYSLLIQEAGGFSLCVGCPSALFCWLLWAWRINTIITMVVSPGSRRSTGLFTLSRRCAVL